MLLSIVDPSAEIREGFETHLITTQDGRMLSGFLTDRDEQVLSLRGLDGQRLTLEHKQIVSDKTMVGSLMPTGLLRAMTDDQLRDLFAYLMSAQPMMR